MSRYASLRGPNVVSLGNVCRQCVQVSDSPPILQSISQLHQLCSPSLFRCPQSQNTHLVVIFFHVALSHFKRLLGTKRVNECPFCTQIRFLVFNSWLHTGKLNTISKLGHSIIMIADSVSRVTVCSVCSCLCPPHTPFDFHTWMIALIH